MLFYYTNCDSFDGKICDFFSCRYQSFGDGHNVRALFLHHRWTIFAFLLDGLFADAQAYFKVATFTGTKLRQAVWYLWNKKNLSWMQRWTKNKKLFEILIHSILHRELIVIDLISLLSKMVALFLILDTVFGFHIVVDAVNQISWLGHEHKYWF